MVNGSVEAAYRQLARITGLRYPELENFVKNADPKVAPRVAQDLHRLARDIESVIDREKRTFRPFPGGPRIRM